MISAPMRRRQCRFMTDTARRANFEVDMEADDTFFNEAMAVAENSRADCILCAGLLLARLWWLGPYSWKLIDRDRFAAAIPGFGDCEIYDLLDASCRNDIFDFNLYFRNLERLPNSNVHAAVATAVIYHDLNETGEAALAAAWMDIILENVEVPKGDAYPSIRH